VAIQVTLPDDKITFKKAEFGDYRELLSVKCGGVYSLYDKDNRCLYVGQSKNLISRLSNHFNIPSAYRDAIDYVTIYFAADPYEREIYETYAISALGGIYNKAKSFKARGKLRCQVELIEDLKYELRTLKTLRHDILEELDALEVHYAEPEYKIYNNNFTGGLAKGHEDDIQFKHDDEDYLEWRQEYEDEKQQLNERLEEIDEEIRGIRRKIKNLLERLRN